MPPAWNNSRIAFCQCHGAIPLEGGGVVIEQGGADWVELFLG